MQLPGVECSQGVSRHGPSLEVTQSTKDTKATASTPVPRNTYASESLCVYTSPHLASSAGRRLLHRILRMHHQTLLTSHLYCRRRHALSTPSDALVDIITSHLGSLFLGMPPFPSIGFTTAASTDRSATLMCLVNPTNPTGDYWGVEEMKAFIERGCDSGTTVIVGEEKGGAGRPGDSRHGGYGINAERTRLRRRLCWE